MSIINQTLRELDARRIDAVVPQAPLQPPAPSGWRKPVLWSLAGGMLAAAGLAAWVMSRPDGGGLPVPAEPVRPEQVAPVASAEPRPVPEPLLEPAEGASAAEPEAVAAPAVAAPALAPAPSIAATAPVIPAEPEAKSAVVSAPPPQIHKQIKPASAEDVAEERYRQAVALLQKGRENQARPLLEEAVRGFPGHVAARQTLAALLSEAGNAREAEAVLQAGRIASPDNAWFALSLARLQAARGDTATAAATLQDGLGGQGVHAEYHATLAALRLQLRQHPEAAQHYQQALGLQAEQGAWWMGLGLALAAQGKTDAARAAFRRALEAGNLTGPLADFVRAKLAE
jgi:MSHA biogenesis protein MshN